MYGIRVAEYGGPDVLEWMELADPVPGPGELIVDVAAAGLNFIDVYQRTGLYKMPLPYTPGLEGAGVVSAVGADVAGFEVGDRVGWVSVLGSYAQLQRLPAHLAVRVPDDVGLDVAAAALLQGMTAHYLAVDTYPLQQGDRCLVHAGAGGVGLLLIQIAKWRGAEVFATVGSDAKAALAKEAGADHVIVYRDSDFGAAVEAIAGSRPLDVIYDGVGQATFDRGLELLRPRGMMVTFGNASGPVAPFAPLRLSDAGSLFLTRPKLAEYIATREELEGRADDLFGWIADGSLHVRIGERMPLHDAAAAHRMIEGRQTTGKVILEP